MLKCGEGPLRWMLIDVDVMMKRRKGRPGLKKEGRVGPACVAHKDTATGWYLF